MLYVPQPGGCPLICRSREFDLVVVSLAAVALRIGQSHYRFFVEASKNIALFTYIDYIVVGWNEINVHKLCAIVKIAPGHWRCNCENDKQKNMFQKAKIQSFKSRVINLQTETLLEALGETKKFINVSW